MASSSSTTIERTEEKATPDMVEYTVLSDAVNVSTGRKSATSGKPEVARLLRGQTITSDPKNYSIQTLLALRAIAPSSKVKERGLPKITARTVSAAGKGAPVVEAVAPVNAPSQGTDGALTADDVRGE